MRLPCNEAFVSNESMQKVWSRAKTVMQLSEVGWEENGVLILEMKRMNVGVGGLIRSVPRIRTHKIPNWDSLRA